MFDDPKRNKKTYNVDDQVESNIVDSDDDMNMNATVANGTTSRGNTTTTKPARGRGSRGPRRARGGRGRAKASDSFFD